MGPIGNWDSVPASNGGGGIIEPGVYTVRITKVEDVVADERTGARQEKPYISVVYDNYDPATRSYRFESVAADPSKDYRHRFRFYYTTGFGLSRYKKLVESCEGSEANRGWRFDPTVPDSERQLVGKWCAMAIGHRLRLNASGEERTEIDLAGCHTVEEGASGRVPVPKLRDERGKGAPARPQQAPACDDVPF